MLPRATAPVTLFAKSPPFCTEDSNTLLLMGLLFWPVTVCTALWVNWRPTAPASPPEEKEALLKEWEPPAWKEPPWKPPPLETFLAEERPFAATINSVSMEPPVWPTLMPRLDIKLSIFWLIFRNATAHRNQMSIFPAAVSLPTDSTSASVMAKMVIDCVSSRLPDSIIAGSSLLFFIDTS